MYYTESKSALYLVWFVQLSVLCFEPRRANQAKEKFMSRFVDEIETKLKKAVKTHYPNLNNQLVHEDSIYKKVLIWTGSVLSGDPLSFAQELIKSIGNNDIHIVKTELEKDRLTISISKNYNKRTAFQRQCLLFCAVASILLTIKIIMQRFF